MYIDIIFFENILMNYIILYATGFLQKRKMTNLRLIISSTAGAIYAIIAYMTIYENTIINNNDIYSI